jgi:hypothetical protein
LRGGDAVEIREILGELRVLNDRYRAIVSHRYAEVIEAPAAAAS